MSGHHWAVAGDIEVITCKRIAAEVRRIAPGRRLPWTHFHDPHAATELALMLERRLTPEKPRVRVKAR